MEAKINVAAILKDKPENTKLYSPLYGDVYFSYIGVRNNICVLHHRFTLSDFFYNGRYTAYKESEIMLFPSKEMRDWSKFAWKKGDVLVSEDRTAHLIFEKFTDETYTTFIGKYHYANNDYYVSECDSAITDLYTLEKENSALTYINTIEERLGGKLNRETLEVEKQYEFKDGDIAFADYGNRQDIFIVSEKTNLSEGYSSFICLDLRCLTLVMGSRTSFFKKDLCKLRLATEEEKQQLFDALAKEGKAWDAEKKQIVDLKPKVELKPFDKVLVRNDKEDQWSANIFSYQVRDNMYYCLGECYWRYCIPYEGNEHLLGTTNNVEGYEENQK